mmetsp:Transcript_29496/g.67996  ORF Transcript_29496/g.67996 Transcript_29496/m.67996 type:complete len:402 (+) Transcript_29496:91-1296(+)
MGPPIDAIVGVSLEVLSTLSGTAGKQLIRLASMWSASHPAASQLALSIGMVVNTLCGPLLDMAAYSKAAQALIAPFGGLDVVWNAALAPYILKEELSRSRLGACCLIFIGTVCSAVFGPHEEEEYTSEFLKETLLSYRVLFYLLGLMVLIVFNILVPMRRATGDVVRGASLGITAGLLAGNMWCVKATVELLEASIHDQQPGIWDDWVIYVMAAGAAFFALSNLIFMTRGLWEFEALFMVTVYEGTMIVANCASAAIVLLETKELSTLRMSLWVLSVLIVISGMVLICATEVRDGKASVETEKLEANEPKTPETECPSSPPSEATEELETCKVEVRAEDILISINQATSQRHLLSDEENPDAPNSARSAEETAMRGDSMDSLSSTVAPEAVGRGRLPVAVS